MKLVLFDLGDTLESDGVLVPGALETLEMIAAFRTNGDPSAFLGLVSDFDMPAEPSEVAIIQQRYYSLLDDLGIRPFFEPVAERVTLSTEVGVFKPDEAVFRAAASKAGPDVGFGDVLFVTENRSHVLAARRLGLAAVHVRGPGQAHGEVNTLAEVVPLVQSFLNGGEPVETVVLDVSSEAPDALLTRIGATDATWTRLGDVLVVRSPAARPGQSPARGELPDSARRLFVPEQHLHVVTQTARLFQEDHPDIRVVVDKGRYLVVDFDAGASLPADGPHASCYRVSPLPADGVVFDQRAAGPGPASPAEAVGVAAVEVSRAAFDDDVGTLARLRTRHSRSAEFRGALAWAESLLADLGYATQIQTVAVPGGTSRNLVADRPGDGDGDGREVVLVTAHLDSVNIQGASAAAPGADDNASGSAGVLAIGRALAGRSTRRGLRLILFGGEEQGLFGSRHYVSGLDTDERARISAVINMDMIACTNTATATVLLEGAPVSQGMIDSLADIAQANTSLAVQTSLAPFNSDHVPFIEMGIPAVLTIEGTDSANDRVHTDRDTLETLDVGLALEILRMNTMFVAQALDSDTSIARPIR
ncbi:M20/M25/M40 family metallo-hydrolase [Pseudarthrobacter sulfonivorans]|uniref:M20/M25/M40 family metallo-hydrolase n=1 Tax=Pseudarthrobacter sulfonivorans TaxID=121292 RepID=UPI0028654F02|nr:M20/M25/M40 family metallo-hydrolase [Pseudarthrobacter sulfonivorans]MDR6417034.1 Zn-dependent M28 family amino/carboxypeptidase/FMN phosphatase YigB (HAD superfamily) [Pseudarthrobacter sulfonivorans]